MQISDSLREQLAVPAWRSGFLAGTIHCKQTEAFMDGMFERLCAQEEETRTLYAQLKSKDERLDELNDDIAAIGHVEAKCRGCGEYTEVDYDIKDFSRDMHYCGRDERCCP